MTNFCHVQMMVSKNDKEHPFDHYAYVKYLDYIRERNFGVFGLEFGSCPPFFYLECHNF
jgi:hypothetical protein